jgi:hypothetical protein
MNPSRVRERTQGGIAQYPEERSFDWKNVAVARRKALRCLGSLAIQR